MSPEGEGYPTGTLNIGAEEDSTGFLRWLRAETLQLTGRATIAWEEANVV